MDRRLELHSLLCKTLGSNNVYYQPPESVKLKYPAIIYSRDSIDNTAADNDLYLANKRYKLILIYTDPDSGLPDVVNALRTATMASHYTADNLYHDVFYMYY